jgi:hypothetical protein
MDISQIIEFSSGQNTHSVRPGPIPAIMTMQVRYAPKASERVSV